MNRARIALFLHLATDVGNGTLVFNAQRYVFPARRQSSGALPLLLVLFTQGEISWLGVGDDFRTWLMAEYCT